MSESHIALVLTDKTIISIASILGLSILTLWIQIRKSLNNCEEDRKELWKAVAELKNKACEVQGCKSRINNF